jgi:hypothetical protein
MVLPSRVRGALRTAHREFVFRRAMRRFLRDPGACQSPGNPVLRDLIYGWGNESWSALDEYLVACVRHALTTSGPSLECGSGLSTLLVGAVATMQGRRHWALEHEPAWAARVQRNLDRYKIDGVALCARPLKDYGDFCWYDPPWESMPDGFSLVICDGPPGSVKGGRYGLVPVMRERLKPGCVIILDDAGRDQEVAIARRWGSELGTEVNVVGTTKPYIEMTVLVGQH